MDNATLEELPFTPDALRVGQVWVDVQETAYVILRLINRKRGSVFCMIIDREMGISYGDNKIEFDNENLVCVMDHTPIEVRK